MVFFQPASQPVWQTNVGQVSKPTPSVVKRETPLLCGQTYWQHRAPTKPLRAAVGALDTEDLEVVGGGGGGEGGIWAVCVWLLVCTTHKNCVTPDRRVIRLAGRERGGRGCFEKRGLHTRAHLKPVFLRRFSSDLTRYFPLLKGRVGHDLTRLKNRLLELTFLWRGARDWPLLLPWLTDVGGSLGIIWRALSLLLVLYHLCPVPLLSTVPPPPTHDGQVTNFLCL